MGVDSWHVGVEGVGVCVAVVKIEGRKWVLGSELLNCWVAVWGEVEECELMRKYVGDRSQEVRACLPEKVRERYARGPRGHNRSEAGEVLDGIEVTGLGKRWFTTKRAMVQCSPLEVTSASQMSLRRSSE